MLRTPEKSLFLRVFVVFACAGCVAEPVLGPSEPKHEPQDAAVAEPDASGPMGCDEGETRPCGFDRGSCRAGIQLCAAAAFGACLGEVGPAPEICNALDDDCDGQVDEDAICGGSTALTCPEDSEASAGQTLQWPVVQMTDASYEARLVSAPPGSDAKVEVTDSALVSVPDLPGSYVFEVCVVSATAPRECCRFSVQVADTCEAPAPPGASTCGTSWDRRPIVQFDPLPADQRYELRLGDDVLPYAVIDAPGADHHRPTIPIGPGGPLPGALVDIHLRACRAGGDACCSEPTTVPVRLVEACSTVMPPAPGHVVISEYVANGDGPCPGGTCEAGEAVEIANLTNCPITLDGAHFAYCNPGSCASTRHASFGAADVVPARGTLVLIRNMAASACAYPDLGVERIGLFGLRVSTAAVEGTGLASGWFNNGGGGLSRLRLASGAFSSMDDGVTLSEVAPYSGGADECGSMALEASACGMVSVGDPPAQVRTASELGRLYHPCDVLGAPADCE